jgi:hypothetical protein
VAKKSLTLPPGLSGFRRYDDTNLYSKDLARYRRHDHGGGADGDGWLDEDEIDRDFERGKEEFSGELIYVNQALESAGFEPNAYFELGEKGHFSIEISLVELKKKKKLN